VFSLLKYCNFAIFVVYPNVLSSTCQKERKKTRNKSKSGSYVL
jgi:hypothetical protein